MKILIFSMICNFLCAVLQLFTYFRSRDPLHLAVSAGFVILGIVCVSKILKEEKKDKTEE